MEARNVRRTVLLAEDEQCLRSMLAVILQEAGYLTLVADNGSRALQLANEYYGKIDVLVSDVQMPGLAGPALAKTLSAVRPDLRVLLMSGSLLDSETFAGQWAFLQKPFAPSKLLEKVRLALSDLT